MNGFTEYKAFCDWIRREVWWLLLGELQVSCLSTKSLVKAILPGFSEVLIVKNKQRSKRWKIFNYSHPQPYILILAFLPTALWPNQRCQREPMAQNTLWLAPSGWTEQRGSKKKVGVCICEILQYSEPVGLPWVDKALLNFRPIFIWMNAKIAHDTAFLCIQLHVNLELCEN